MRHKKCTAGKCETSQYGKQTDTYSKKLLLFIKKHRVVISLPTDKFIRLYGGVLFRLDGCDKIETKLT